MIFHSSLEIELHKKKKDQSLKCNNNNNNVFEDSSLAKEMETLTVSATSCSETKLASTLARLPGEHGMDAYGSEKSTSALV